MFRRPKKTIQRRVFSIAPDEDDNTENENTRTDVNRSDGGSDDEKMDVDPVPHQLKERKNEKRTKDADRKVTAQKTSLLSFGDEDDEGEVFQVKKSSQSKKVMKMLDKERRKKKRGEVTTSSAVTTTTTITTGAATIGASAATTSSDHYGNGSSSSHRRNDMDSQSDHTKDVGQATFHKSAVPNAAADNLANKKRQKNINSNSSIHTEIRTDDFVLVVKKTEPQNNLILNGRAALCAGRDDMSSEDESHENEDGGEHRFNKPDQFKTLLESGAIPDAAMIHAARKKRQKARELGDFVSLEEKKPIDNRKGRLVRDDVDDDISDDEERVDMSAITGVKEREERREKFYSVQQDDSDQDTDPDMHEWENQQIRKGVTGAQLISARHESSIYAQYLRKLSPVETSSSVPMSTGNLLEQAYARNALEKPRKMLIATQKSDAKPSGPRMPDEVFKKMQERLTQVKELNATHLTEIERITRDLQLTRMNAMQSEQDAPIAASKYRFYQELRGYVHDLIECLDEKLPKIVELERKAIAVMSKQSNVLIERRRQDMRDQAKEATQKPITSERVMSNAARKEEDERIRRAAEREGRRTRRRRNRERDDVNNKHLDGMSSDDEIADQDAAQYKNQLKQIDAEAAIIFDDVTDEFSQTSLILRRFELWRQRDRSTYTNTYFSLCLPKILGPLLRLSLITWNPLDKSGIDLERMEWYEDVMRYGFDESESEATLIDDPDVRLVPTLIEKFVLPKITELIETCWDPLSSSQTLKIVELLGRLGRDYPSMRPTSKYTRTLFLTILDKMKAALDNDVFIPIFPKQLQEAKSSFFQRQFSSALKLLRNFLMWQGILSDIALKEIAILSLLNRYLLLGIRVCTPVDAVTKAHNIVNTLPRVWLQQKSILDSLNMFITFLRTLLAQLDRKNAQHIEAIDKMTKILQSLHSSVEL